VEFVGRDQATHRLGLWAADSRPVFVLTSDPDTMAALVSAGHGAIRRVNLGGIHSGPGRRERLRYVYLTDAEMNTLRRLEEQGAVITAQDVPGATAVPFRSSVTPEPLIWQRCWLGRGRGGGPGELPQAMLGRPLVAATVAGLLLGSVETGLLIVLLECFALDVLPVGASRYPDYGPAAVIAVFAAWLVPDQTGGPC
jgi:hypothetical protein